MKGHFNKPICAIMTSLVLILGTFALVLPYQEAEAKPIKLSETVNDLIDLSCSSNHGILKCSIKSHSGGTVKNVSLNNPNSEGLSTCDGDTSEKKRISVTNRKSVNCPNETEPFIEGQTWILTVQFVDGSPANLQVEVTHLGSTIEF